MDRKEVVRKKVVIGLSGGLDSAMAALLLKREGFQVIGLHFSFGDEKYPDSLKEIKKKLDFQVLTEDIKDDFEIVKKHFVDEYLQGRTPSPCTYCNRVIKWKKLIDCANQNACDFIASGHYIRKKEQNGHYYLRKAVDPVKDQSYFLWELGSDVIKKMINPLGDYTKDEIRNIARENGFVDLAEKKESMGVCFLHNKDYRDFLKQNIPEQISKIGKGDVVDSEGNLIGTHKGYIYYTIGQKRDLNLMDSRKAYVTEIDPERNTITVDKKESLNHHHILLKQIQLINNNDLSIGSMVQIDVRGYGLNPDSPAEIIDKTPDSITFKLNDPAWAVAPGQPVVLYNHDIVLGGGIAEKSW